MAGATQPFFSIYFALIAPMEITYQDIFATRLWITKLDHLSPHFELWRSEIQKLRDSDMEPRGKSNRMGWNSQPTIMTLPAFRPLFDECVKAFNFAIKRSRRSENIDIPSRLGQM